MLQHTNLLQPITTSKPYIHLVSDVEKGELKVPDFQRPFVWRKEQTAKLFDSIIRGYPIGSFIFWRTKERLLHIRNIGNYSLPELGENEYINYILDGQQRITSLFALKKGVVFNWSNKVKIDYRDIYINLDAHIETDNDIVVVEKNTDNILSVYDLLNQDMVDLFTAYPNYAKKINDYKNKLENYQFTTITLADYPIEVACDVFTRLNTGGTQLNLFDIMVAKTYDEKVPFNLAQKFSDLLDRNIPNNLSSANYGTIERITTAQCVSAILTGEIKREEMLHLSKKDFIAEWPHMTVAIRRSIDFARTNLGAEVSQLLPYASSIIPLTYFFRKNGGKDADPIQIKFLKQLFFWIALTWRYSSAVESKMALDIKKVDSILKFQAPNYGNEMITIDPSKIGIENFSAGNARSKAVMCLLAMQHPLSFKTHAKVILDNSWLSRSNSKNYHHFFPKAWLRKNGFEEWQTNYLANITLVKSDENLNIRDKAPKTYIAEFQKLNPNIDIDLKSHLIDINGNGISNNDYDKFIEDRSKWIADELNAILAVK